MVPVVKGASETYSTPPSPSLVCLAGCDDVRDDLDADDLDADDYPDESWRRSARTSIFIRYLVRASDST